MQYSEITLFTIHIVYSIELKKIQTFGLYLQQNLWFITSGLAITSVALVKQVHALRFGTPKFIYGQGKKI